MLPTLVTVALAISPNVVDAAAPPPERARAADLWYRWLFGAIVIAAALLLVHALWRRVV